jgi:transposase
MRDTELYRHLLGLETPWTVARVELDAKQHRIDVWVQHGSPKSWPCPDCGVGCRLHDHDEERTWRHLDSCHFQTHLHARVPRIDCPQHGVLQVRVPWAEPRSRFTLLFERFAIDVLLECDVKAAADILGISWDEAHAIMERAVARGLLRREPHTTRQLGIDEKSLAKGRRFATLVNDLERGIVIEVAEERTKAGLLEALGGFSLDDLAAVEAVAMDMSGPYLATLREVMANADEKIVFDRYHIVSHMNEALNQVRHKENKQLRSIGDERLVGTKHQWLYGEENLPEKYAAEFDVLRASTLKTARAWALKESLRDLWDCATPEEGANWWKRWYFWATHSRLPPVITVAKMLKRHLANVLSYFRHRITNAVSESINSVIQMLKKRAFGYRSFSNFRTTILFRCGGLELYPVSHPKAG